MPQRTLALPLVLLSISCGGRAEDPAGDSSILADEPAACTISLRPVGSLARTVAVSQTVELAVLLVSECNGAVPDGGVSFSIEGSTSGATLAPPTISTDEQGYAATTFAAGSTPAQLAVVAKHSDEMNEVRFTISVTDDGGACVDHCSNGVSDCGEAGVDCGGGCDACADPCLGHCSNGVIDCGESGTDCGGGGCGSCLDPCAGHCSNGVTDCGEGDVDCGGGGCASCIDPCAGHCSNGVTDCGEGGVDCGGGGCGACIDPCDGHCSNGARDCGESGVDCGGGCGACPDPCDNHCQNGAFDCGESGGVDCGGGGCGACTGTDDAAAQANTLPAQMPCSATTTATVTMLNTGTTSWYRNAGAGFKLGFVGDFSNPFIPAGGSPRSQFPEDLVVAPGETVTFTVAIESPATAGTYTAEFRMVHELVAWFGATATKTITLPAGCGGTLPPPTGQCGVPLPTKDHFRSKINMHCGNRWCDATPTCHGCDYCAAIGLGCMPGSGPNPPCTPRCDCPVRPDGHPERSACEAYFLGGDPWWRSDGNTIVKSDNKFLARCEGCSWIEVCAADGTKCKRVTF